MPYQDQKQKIKTAKTVTLIGLAVNLALFAFKLASGIWGKSNAMLADAAHTLSDLVTDLIVLTAISFGAKPVDKCHDYGHGKSETLASAIVGCFLIFVGFKICLSSISKIFGTFQGTLLPSPGWIAFYAAFFSTLIKEWLFRYTFKSGQKIDSQAMITNAWHHRSDMITSIGAMLGIGGAIILGKTWRILDPLTGIILSIIVLKTAVTIIRQAINELLEASLSPETEQKIIEALKSIPALQNPHQLRTRKIGNKVAVDVHIEVDRSLNIVEAHDIATKAEKKIVNLLGAGTFISVHVEPS